MRWSRLSGRRQRLLFEAAATLIAVSVALRVLPFRRVIRLGAVSVRGRSEDAAEDCIWAMEAAARRLPWPIVCIQKGIAGQRLLRRHGIDAKLHYGIANPADRPKLEAHVWVTVGGEPVIGGTEARAFAPVAAYP